MAIQVFRSIAWLRLGRIEKRVERSVREHQQPNSAYQSFPNRTANLGANQQTAPSKGMQCNAMQSKAKEKKPKSKMRFILVSLETSGKKEGRKTQIHS